MKQITILLITSLLLSMVSLAQDHMGVHDSLDLIKRQTGDLVPSLKLSSPKLKLSGYIQMQYQHAESAAALKIGAPNENIEKSFDRIGIRRGRIKLDYQEGIVQGVVQLDLTEKGVGLKDAYLSIQLPYVASSTLKAGVLDRPFGYEISYSSSSRASPERSTVFQTLFPDERDLGGLLTFQPKKSATFNFIKLEAGLFAGNGIEQETDSRQDFIGHLSLNKSIKHKIQYGLGISYYNGSVYQGTENVFTMTNKGFKLNSDPSNKGAYAKRIYWGFDAQFSFISLFGKSQLMSEYIKGTQPGGKLNSMSPNASVLPTSDVYIRNFMGMYILLIQDLGQFPLSGVIKYDWYNPNTQVKGNEIGLNQTGKGDLAYYTLGLGLIWKVNKQTNLQAYYEVNTNEKTTNLVTHINDIDDNVFTLRLQVKF